MDSQPDSDRPQLRRAAAAQSVAEIHRRPVVGGADPGHDHDAPRVHRGLPRRQQTLLPPGGFGKGGGSAVVREVSQLLALSYEPSATSWRLLLFAAIKWTY